MNKVRILVRMRLSAGVSANISAQSSDRWCPIAPLANCELDLGTQDINEISCCISETGNTIKRRSKEDLGISSCECDKTDLFQWGCSLSATYCFLPFVIEAEGLFGYADPFSSIFYHHVLLHGFLVCLFTYILHVFSHSFHSFLLETYFLIIIIYFS